MSLIRISKSLIWFSSSDESFNSMEIFISSEIFLNLLLIVLISLILFSMLDFSLFRELSFE